MEILKTVGVKDLKNNLSAYLKEVGRGLRLLVTDRNVVVAELRQPIDGLLGLSPEQERLANWLSKGQIKLPSKDQKKTPVFPFKFPAGTAQKLLDEDRGS